MCELLGVCRSAYYIWIRAVPSVRAQERQKLSQKIKAIFIDSRRTYGTRRIRQVLANAGIKASRRRIGKLMAEQDLFCKARKKFKVTTDSHHRLPISPNLLSRNFVAEHKDQIYVGDITYVPTQEGWLYLAVVIDLFSRKVVGWSMDNHMRASLVNNALLMAIWSRKPNRGLIWHTDRGSQYASQSHRELLKDHGIEQSMSRKGDCWDNAVSESFFHTLKVEALHHRSFKTREEAKTAIFEYIEVFYNRVRIHSSNDYLSPVAFELAQNFC
jgi:putative transposase